jgi:small redox-active disulfide protein 2
MRLGAQKEVTVKTITILGTGCPKCRQLAANAETAARELALEYRVEKVADINKIMAYGVMLTPALVVDGEVKVVGKVPTPEQIKDHLRGTRGEGRGAEMHGEPQRP